MTPWLLGIVLAVLALLFGVAAVVSRRRRLQAETELQRAVGSKVRALAEGPGIEMLVEVVGTLVQVTPDFIDLAGDYEDLPYGAKRYRVSATLLRVPLRLLVEVSFDGTLIHVRT